MKLNVILCECVFRSFYTDGDFGFALQVVMYGNAMVCVRVFCSIRDFREWEKGAFQISMDLEYV